MGRKCITFYTDNNNAEMDLIKSDSKRRIIPIPVRIFRAIVARGGITPWFARAPTDFNIADKPARCAKLPYRIKDDRISRPVRIFYGRSLKLRCGAIGDFPTRVRYFRGTTPSKSTFGIFYGRWVGFMADYSGDIRMFGRPIVRLPGF